MSALVMLLPAIRSPRKTTVTNPLRGLWTGGRENKILEGEVRSQFTLGDG